MTACCTTTLAERPDLRSHFARLHAAAWPAFMLHDPIAHLYWDDLETRMAEYQVLLCSEDEQVLAVGNAVPVGWDGTAAGLPAGWDAALQQGVSAYRDQEPATALSALAAIVDPACRGRGLSRLVVEALKEVAAQHGLADLIAPVRPSHKSCYPLTPMERYLSWVEPDGLPFDPWVRVHVRLGATIVRLAPRSMVIPGTVAEWEEWAQMRFPESGSYIVPGALQPVVIDRGADQGLYEEPNVWMRHRVALPPAT